MYDRTIRFLNIHPSFFSMLIKRAFASIITDHLQDWFGAKICRNSINTESYGKPMRRCCKLYQSATLIKWMSFYCCRLTQTQRTGSSTRLDISGSPPGTTAVFLGALAIHDPFGFHGVPKTSAYFL